MQTPKLACALALICCISSLFAQTPAHQIFGAERGLPTTSTFAVLQDHAGDILVASPLGVYRYDGKRFSVITDSLDQPWRAAILKMRTGPDHTVYPLCSWDGCCRIDGNYVSKPTQLARIPFGSRQVLIEDYDFDAQGDLWAIQRGTVDAMLISRADTNQVDTFRCDFIHGREPMGHLVKLPGTRKWLGYFSIPTRGKRDSTLAMIDQWRGEGQILTKTTYGYALSQLNVPEKKLRSGGSAKCLQTASKLWVTLGTVAVAKDLKTGAETVFRTGAEIVGVDSLGDGTIALLTRKGIYFQYPGETEWEHLFRNDLVTSIEEDHEGAIWMSTLTQGLIYIPTLSLRTLDIEGLSDKRIESVRKNDELLVVQPFGNKLFILQRESDQWKEDVYTGKGINFLSNKSFLPLELHEDTLWRGTDFMDLNNRTFHNVDMRYLRAYCFRDKTPFGLREGDIVRIGTDLVYELPDSPVDRATIFWHDSVFVLGTTSGVQSYNPTTQVFDSNYLKLPELFNCRALSMLNDSVFVIGTGKGIALARPGELTYVTEEDGLTANLNFGGSPENDSTFWVGTLKGLNRVLVRKDGTYRIDHMGLPQGLNPESPRTIHFHNDTLYLGTSKGVRFLDLKRFNPKQEPIQVKLHSININDSLLADISQVILPTDERNLRFNFEVASFRPGADVEYAYRLAGYHDDWLITSEDFAAYYNVLPGDYRFEAKARSRNGRWTDIAVEVPVSVPQTLTEKPWFWIVSAAWALVLITGGMFWYFRQRDLRRTAQNDYSNAQLKALGLQMNPHFLFNALNNIQGLSYLGEHQKTNKFMAKLAVLTRSMLENSNKPVIPLSDELNNVREYLSMEQMRFENRPFEFVVEVEEQLQSCQAMIPPMLIQPLVENAVWHGLLPKSNDRQLWVRCTGNQDDFHISVRDNGVGMGTHKSKSDPTKSSISLKNLEQRISLYNQLEYGQASYRVHSEASGPDAGTEITFAFKNQVLS